MGGIYKIMNLITGKIYLGSAVNPNSRKRTHFSTLDKGKHHSILLQRAYNKYKRDNFVFEMIISCPDEYLIKLEQWFIDNLKPEYNILKIAGSLKGFKFSEESKKKLSEMRKGEKNVNFGKSFSDETKKKLSLKAKERMNDSEIFKKYMNGHKYRMKSVIQKDTEDNIINEFESVREAAKETGFNRTFISRTCNGHFEIAYGYKWEFSK